MGKHLFQARLKTRKSWKFLSEIFKSEFSILTVGKIKNSEIRKFRQTFPRVLRFPSFWFAIFSFFKNDLFQYSKVGNSVLYIYVMYCFQRLLKCFFFQQKYIMFKILTSHNKIYLLWDVSVLKSLSFLQKLLKKWLTSLRKNMQK